MEIGEEAVEEGGGGTVDVDEVASGLRRTTSSRLAEPLNSRLRDTPTSLRGGRRRRITTLYPMGT